MPLHVTITPPLPIHTQLVLKVARNLYNQRYTLFAVASANEDLLQKVKTIEMIVSSKAPKVYLVSVRVFNTI